MRVLWPSFGFFRVGLIPWSGDFGIEVAWGLVEKREGYYHRFRHSHTLQLLSREAWIDFGWWVLWPIHFQRHLLSEYDNDVCRWEIDPISDNWRDHKPVFLPHIKASAWTGRDHEVVGVYFQMFGWGWAWRL